MGSRPPQPDIFSVSSLADTVNTYSTISVNAYGTFSTVTESTYSHNTVLFYSEVI